MTQNPLIAFWIAFGVAASLAYPIWKALLALKSRQTIDRYAPETHQAKQGTPTMGGLIVLAGWLPALVATQTDGGAIAALLGFSLIGFLDDFVVPRWIAGKRGLGWKQKIVLQLLAAAGSAVLVPEFQGDWAWLALCGFLVLFFSNAFNFADGLDGLAGSLGIVLCVGLLAIGVPSAAGLGAVALIGALIPFLFLNAPPARVFMGDVGSLPIGAFLGLTYARMLHGGWTAWPGFPWLLFGALAAMNLVLILELVLVPLQVGYYKRTKRRIFPATPIHHAFEVRGWPESRVVWTFVLAQVLCVLLAMTVLQSGARPSGGVAVEPQVRR